MHWKLYSNEYQRRQATLSTYLCVLALTKLNSQFLLYCIGKGKNALVISRYSNEKRNINLFAQFIKSIRGSKATAHYNNGTNSAFYLFLLSSHTIPINGIFCEIYFTKFYFQLKSINIMKLLWMLTIFSLLSNMKLN